MSNLLPIPKKAAIIRLYRKRLVGLGLTALACLVFVTVFLLLPSFFLLKSEQIVFMTKRDTLASYETSKIAHSLTATVNDINTRLNVFPDISNASPIIAGLIDPILKVKTKAIHLSDFSYSAGVKATETKVQISGTADSRGDLLYFADKIKATGTFANVNVPITSFIKDSNVTFTITATVAMQPEKFN